MGLLKGSLYYYVRSKEDLLYQLTLRVHNDAMANLERVEALDGDPVDKIRSLVRGHIQTLAGSTAMTQVFYYEYRHLSPDRRREISLARRRYETFLADLIRDGQRAGLLVEDADPWVAAIGLLTMINSIVMWFDAGGRVSTEQICTEYEGLVLRSLGAGPSAEVSRRGRAGTADGSGPPPRARPKTGRKATGTVKR